MQYSCTDDDEGVPLGTVYVTLSHVGTSVGRTMGLYSVSSPSRKCSNWSLGVYIRHPSRSDRERETIRVARRSYLKTGYRPIDAECVELGGGEWAEGISLPRRTRRSGERRMSLSGVPVKNENSFCALFIRKPPLANRILLNVAKCCVTKLR